MITAFPIAKVDSMVFSRPNISGAINQNGGNATSSAAQSSSSVSQASSSSAVQSSSSIVQPSSSSSLSNSSSSLADDTPVINGKITDARDGNVYKVVEIGDQTWMAENLRYLPSLNSSYGVYDYDGTDVEEAKATTNYQNHGVLYSYNAAIGSSYSYGDPKACPVGWDIPTIDEWNVLINNAGGAENAGVKLKATSGWLNGGNGNDAYGFAATAGGYLYNSYSIELGAIGKWWGINETNNSSGRASLTLNNTDNTIDISISENQNNGISVRCIKSNLKPLRVEFQQKELGLNKDSSAQVSFEVFPKKALAENLIWSSTNTSVATVDEHGKVTGKSKGVAKIIAQTAINGVADTCVFYVWEYGLNLTDARDNNVYKTVTIGTQTWMAENLRYLPSLNGTTQSYDDPKYYVYGYTGSSVAEAKTSSYYKKYGALYNWPAALEACPAGWHLPTDAEWAVLEDYVGGSSVAGVKLKATNFYGIDQYGFGALPGGYFLFGDFYFESNYGYWWSATESNASYAYYRYLGYSYDYMYRNDFSKSYGFSVRCAQD